MKRSMDTVQASPFITIGDQSRNVINTLTNGLPRLSRLSSPLALYKEVAYAARASAMLVEEADERMMKPWYRHLPSDTAKRKTTE